MDEDERVAERLSKNVEIKTEEEMMQEARRSLPIYPYREDLLKAIEDHQASYDKKTLSPSLSLCFILVNLLVHLVSFFWDKRKCFLLLSHSLPLLHPVSKNARIDRLAFRYVSSISKSLYSSAVSHRGISSTIFLLHESQLTRSAGSIPNRY